MNKFIIPTILIFVCVYSSFSQDSIASNDDNRKKAVFALGGMGPAIPVGQFGKQREVGFDFNTAIEFQYKRGLIVRGMFDFSTFQFNKGTLKINTNGKQYDISSSNNLVSVFLAAGYHYTKGRLSPYGFAGMGASFVSVPSVVIDDVNNTIENGLNVGSYFSTVAGVGADFILNPPKKNTSSKKTPFMLYAESFYTFIPGTTEASIYKFNLLSINVGIKSKF
ncbi:MAG: hypothetical protein JSS73_14735 [Bacteroidetes bacterium]|nr:hypothetical protein [Bacteroidota bacterium]